MAKEVTVVIKKDGTVEVRGEGFETKSLKKALEGLGEVIERHEGHDHVHDHEETETKQRT